MGMVHASKMSPLVDKGGGTILEALSAVQTRSNGGLDKKEIIGGSKKLLKKRKNKP